MITTQSLSTFSITCFMLSVGMAMQPAVGVPVEQCRKMAEPRPGVLLLL